MKKIISSFQEHKALLDVIMTDNTLQQTICSGAEAICKCLNSGGKLLLCGNGGSAADAMHITAEFVGSFNRPKEPLAAVCLNTNVSVMSALANDTDYRYVFSKQLEALACKGDLLIVLTTSGKSANVLEALKTAKEKGIPSIALCGANTDMVESDNVIAIPSCDTPRVQEMHMLIGHYFAQCVENYFLDGENNE